MLHKKQQTTSQTSCRIRSHIYISSFRERTWFRKRPLLAGTWFSSGESRQCRKADGGSDSFVTGPDLARGRKHGNQIPTGRGRALYDGSVLEEKKQSMRQCLCRGAQALGRFRQRKTLQDCRDLCQGGSPFPRSSKGKVPKGHCPSHIQVCLRKYCAGVYSAPVFRNPLPERLGSDPSRPARPTRENSQEMIDYVCCRYLE